MLMKTIKFNFDIVGGIAHVYAIEPANVRSINTHPITGYSRIAIVANANIIELPVYAPTATSFQENHSISKGVDIYDVSISVEIPRQNDPIILEELRKGEWLVIHQDANGDIWMSGTKDIPLRFSTSHMTDNDVNINSGTFSGKEPGASLMIDRRAFFIE